VIIISLINLRKGWLPLIKKLLLVLLITAILYAVYRWLGPADALAPGVSTVLSLW
jgi:uncharacterized protein YqhQ